MNDPMIYAYKRLPSPSVLGAVLALLGVPELDEAKRNLGAGRQAQQTTLLARLADWAALSVKAQAELGDHDFSGVTSQYAYLVETTYEFSDGHWSREDGDSGGGIEDGCHDSPATFALTVLDQYVEHIRASIERYEDFLDELHVRVSVWDVDRVVDSGLSSPPQQGREAHFSHYLKASKISPEAVEVRTPAQVWAAVRDRKTAS